LAGNASGRRYRLHRRGPGRRGTGGSGGRLGHACRWECQGYRDGCRDRHEESANWHQSHRLWEQEPWIV